MRLLAALFGANLADDDRLRLDEAATEVHASAAFLEALQMSHGDLANLLRTALRATHPSTAGNRTYVWTRDVYDAAVVYELSTDDQTELYQRSYTVADGVVTLGDPVKVIAVTQYVAVDTAEVTTPATVPVTQISRPAAESERTDLTGDLVPLVERAVKDDGTALVKIIQAGQGSSGYYPADVLKRDAGVFAAGTHIYLDHPSASEERDRPERSVKDLAGSLTGPAEWKEDGVAGPGVYAPVRFIDSVAPHLNDIAAISGMSIIASGTTGTREIDGKPTYTIESIDTAYSVDVVTRPGAGGKIVELLEAARGNHTPRVTPPPKETAPMNLQEQLDAATADLEATKTKLGEAQQRIDAQDRELARLREQNILREADAVIAETLADMELHQLTRERLTKQLIASPPVKDGELDRDLFQARVTEAAKAEQNYLVLSTGSGGVRGMGGGDADADATKELAAVFEAAGYAADVAARMAAR